MVVVEDYQSQQMTKTETVWESGKIGDGVEESKDSMTKI